MYFDKTNNYFEDYSTYNDINLNINNINFNRDISTYSNKEGFNKGNMFPSIYSKYKNHEYKLNVNNQRDELLYKIQMNAFALIDYNLYLDMYPNDTKILNEFINIKDELNKLTSEYESKYGVICQSKISDSSKWNWIDNPWPWDRR